MYQYKRPEHQIVNTLHILMVNNKPVEREGIKVSLAEKYELDVTIAPYDHHAIPELLNNKTFDFVILDSIFPGESAYELVLLIRQIRETLPSLPVLVMGSGNHHIALWVLRAGATGYIDKGCDQKELLASVDCMIHGRKYLNQNIAEQLPLLWNKATESVFPHHNLSAREHQVMLLLATGISLTEIGKKMGLSVKTVSTYKSRLLEKMGMESAVDLIKYAVKLGLVST